MRQISLVLLATTLVGCFNYESFQRRQIKESCLWAEKCGYMSEETISECVDAQDDQIKANSTCGGFDSEAASRCLDEIGELGCMDFSGLISLEICAEVCP